MKKAFFSIAFLAFLSSAAFGWAVGPFYEAEDPAVATLGSWAEIVTVDSFASKKGVARKPLSPDVALEEKEAGKADASLPPDITFSVEVRSPGRYFLVTTASADESGKARSAAARNKYDSHMMIVSVDGAIPSPRVIVSPWKNQDNCVENLGKFDFAEKKASIRIWLPVGIRLDSVKVVPYQPRPVPEKAAAWTPTITPPADHPRLWVTPESLPEIRRRLTVGENAEVWRRLQKEASASFDFSPPEGITVGHDVRLLRAVRAKGFVYLVTGDERLGREAVDLAIRFLSRVEYGNILDITREIGETIYSGSLIFDWCHPLLSEEEEEIFQKNLLRLAEDMEIGWPPFGQSIVNGHGNEAQVLRDLLTMGIALYERDPLPWNYCAYRILEELVPMRRFEYESPRHNQGLSYAAFRFRWEITAAILFKRMIGREVFAPNIKNLGRWFLFSRLPGGGTLRDGDGLPGGPYWKYADLALALSSYAEDTVLKGEFKRQQSIPDPVVFLLLNDPGLPADESLESLPLAFDSGPILSSQILRTGWDNSPESGDTIIEVKGGCYHFGNHQHADSGAFQIFHRGFLAADLGQYHFYGTPYDQNFAKRSVAHSVPLVFKPDEKFLGAENDGGQRYIQAHPKTPEEATSNPTFRTGRLIASEILPSKEKPDVAFFTVDLTPAWSPEKIAEHRRSFAWIRTDDSKNPVILLVFDKIESKKEEYKKFWQLNSLTEPETRPDGSLSILSIPPSEQWPNPRTKNDAEVSEKPSPSLRGKLTVTPIFPQPESLDVDFIGGDRANSVFGQSNKAPQKTPEATGWRSVWSPKKAAKSDLFLFLLTVGDEDVSPPTIPWEKTENGWRFSVGPRVVTLDQQGNFSLEK